MPQKLNPAACDRHETLPNSRVGGDDDVPTSPADCLSNGRRPQLQSSHFLLPCDHFILTKFLRRIAGLSFLPALTSRAESSGPLTGERTPRVFAREFPMKLANARLRPSVSRCDLRRLIHSHSIATDPLDTVSFVHSFSVLRFPQAPRTASCPWLWHKGCLK